MSLIMTCMNHVAGGAALADYKAKQEAAAAFAAGIGGAGVTVQQPHSGRGVLTPAAKNMEFFAKLELENQGSLLASAPPPGTPLRDMTRICIMRDMTHSLLVYSRDMTRICIMRDMTHGLLVYSLATPRGTPLREYVCRYKGHDSCMSL